MAFLQGSDRKLSRGVGTSGCLPFLPGLQSGVRLLLSNASHPHPADQHCFNVTEISRLFRATFTFRGGSKGTLGPLFPGYRRRYFPQNLALRSVDTSPHRPPAHLLPYNKIYTELAQALPECPLVAVMSSWHLPALFKSLQLERFCHTA